MWFVPIYSPPIVHVFRGSSWLVDFMAYIAQWADWYYCSTIISKYKFQMWNLISHLILTYVEYHVTDPLQIKVLTPKEEWTALSMLSRLINSNLFTLIRFMRQFIPISSDLTCSFVYFKHQCCVRLHVRSFPMEKLQFYTILSYISSYCTSCASPPVVMLLICWGWMVWQ